MIRLERGSLHICTTTDGEIFQSSTKIFLASSNIRITYIAISQTNIAKKHLTIFYYANLVCLHTYLRKHKRMDKIDDSLIII